MQFMRLNVRYDRFSSIEIDQIDVVHRVKYGQASRRRVSIIPNLNLSAKTKGRVKSRIAPKRAAFFN